MNIFATNENPKLASMDLDDRRLIKGILETTMMLSTALYIRNIWNSTLYRPTHEHHPCTRWAAYSQNNFRWLYHYGMFQCDEYTYRYDKEHSSRAIIRNAWVQFNKRKEVFPRVELTDFANVTPFKTELDICEAYRKYLICDKWGPLTKWTRRGKPSWFRLKERA